jgi:hypothetical protein
MENRRVTNDPFDPSSIANSDALALGLADRPTVIADGELKPVVERMVAMYRAAKRDQAAAPPPYQPTGEWSDFIAERAGLYAAIEAGDVDATLDLLRDFWRHPLLGVIVKEYAQYPQLAAGESDFVERFERNVGRNFLIWKEIFGRPTASLAIPRVGNPWGLALDGELIAPKATRYHAHAETIANLVAGVSEPFVAELGAGYGGTAYYFLRDNPKVSYIDFDLPETLVIAAFYLLACLPGRKALLYGEHDIPLSAERIAEHDIILLPNYCLPELPDGSVDVFLNAFSLSEMRPQAIEACIGEIQRASRGYFLHNNMDRRGVVNRGFERIPASTFPIDGARLKLIYKHFDLFHGHDGDYREFLYERI